MTSEPDNAYEPAGNPIDREAADWVARLDRGALSADEETRLSAWIAADVRHRGAFVRAQSAIAFLDRAKALGPRFTLATAEAAPAWAPHVRSAGTGAVAPSRRTLLTAGGAAAASIAGGLVFGPEFISRLFPAKPPQVYASEKGQIKLVSLTDASVLTLNTHSLVAVDYTGERRSVELMEGEVLFSVAKDHDRPFSVVAGGIEVRAVGTSFTVRHLDGRAPEVLVQEGMVDVAYRAQPDSLVRAAANTRVTGDSNGSRGHLVKAILSPAAIERETAWRQGMIAFEGVSLGTAAAEFSRYSDTRIVIDDATIANMTITGLFEAANPAGFTEAVASSLGLKVTAGQYFVRLHAN